MQIFDTVKTTRRCGSVYLGVVVLDIGRYIAWESACTSVQGLMIRSTEYWDSLTCCDCSPHICKVEHVKCGCKDYI